MRTPYLQLSAMQEGDYTFQLTVTDSARQRSTAEVTLIVQPGRSPAGTSGSLRAEPTWCLSTVLKCIISPHCTTELAVWMSGIPASRTLTTPFSVKANSRSKHRIVGSPGGDPEVSRQPGYIRRPAQRYVRVYF